MSTAADSRRFLPAGLEERAEAEDIVNSADLPIWPRGESGAGVGDGGAGNRFDSRPGSVDGLLHSGCYPSDWRAPWPGARDTRTTS